MATRSRDLPDEELFMSRPLDDDSPSVEPLRIHKPTSPKPQGIAAPSDRFRYPTPPHVSSSSSSSKPAFSLPPGASSSAAPLPYPDDFEERIAQHARTKRAPYPVDEEEEDGADEILGRTPASPAPVRLHGCSSSSSVGSHPGYNDTSPRLTRPSPIDKKGSGLAERRGAAPITVSPVSPGNDMDNFFAKPIRAPAPRPSATTPAAPSQHQPLQKPSTHYQNKPYYYPPPAGTSSSSSARHPSHGADAYEPTVNRFGSTASNSTTRANRGSPPPPETPIAEPGMVPGGPGQLPALSSYSNYPASHGAPSTAAQSRLAQYGGQRPTVQQQQPTQQQPTRPWTPSETGDHPHPITVFQGNEAISTIPSSQQKAQQHQHQQQQHGSDPSNSQAGVLEQDFQCMQASTPPPAYTSLGATANAARPAEKQRPPEAGASNMNNANHNTSHTPDHGQVPPAAAEPGPILSPRLPQQQQPQQQPAIAIATEKKPSAAQQHPGHPAFAHDYAQADANGRRPVTPSATRPVSPPPMPEGWIAHLDQNSGQYYYIHIATQATQWEFPTGPTPLNHETAPLSPTASTYGNPLVSPFLGSGGVGKPSLASPGIFPPQTPGGYAESIASVAVSQAPTAAGFTGPPPSAGVDVFQIKPTNGVYFGPYLRYGNMDVERGVWRGSIMIVTEVPQPPTIHIHLSVDLSPNPRQLVPQAIHTHQQRWTFYRYDVDLAMGEGTGTDRWTYAITSHLGCTRYEFVVAGRHELGWRVLAHSGNDFAPLTSQAERTRLGGISFMWKDVLQKNIECGGFHVQLGLGNQVYADRIWREVALLRQWADMPGREKRMNVKWTARHEEDVTHAYFHYYSSHFDQPFLREAFAQIPHVLQIDDHDIFDGFGSYPDYMQSSHIFKNIGRVAGDMYLLFQHHTTLEMLRQTTTSAAASLSDHDLFTITGQGWHFVKFLGPGIAVVGPDCRSERTPGRVLSGSSYQGILPRVSMLPPSVQHCIWMVSVPVVYPRLESIETLAHTISTGKKAVNTGYNFLGRVTSNVAGVVGGKAVVASGFSHVKKAVGKGGLMGHVLNQFGDFDLAPEMRDLWTHDSKDLERTYLIRTLQGIAHSRSIRMTFLSGDVNCAGAGLLHDPSHPSDHKTMYQIITSPIVAQPTSSYLLKTLHNERLLYVPVSGKKSTHDVSDTKEDMMEIFLTDASGAARDLKKLIGRRNYLAIMVYDTKAVAAAAAGQLPPGTATYAPSVASGSSPQGQGQGLVKLSLMVDFVVQGDGAYAGTTKYGPVIVPYLESGH